MVLTFSSCWSQGHSFPIRFEWKFFRFFFFSKLKLLASSFHMCLFICLKEPQPDAQRSAVPLKPTNYGTPTSNVQTVHEALGRWKGQKNQRALYTGHTPAHLCTGGSTVILYTSCVSDINRRCMVPKVRLSSCLGFQGGRRGNILKKEKKDLNHSILHFRFLNAEIFKGNWDFV